MKNLTIRRHNNRALSDKLRQELMRHFTRPGDSAFKLRLESSISSPLWIAKRNKRIVGLAMEYYRRQNRIFIGVYVPPKLRHKKIGRTLLKTVTKSPVYKMGILSFATDTKKKFFKYHGLEDGTAYYY